jgi:hypothetical protein
MRYIIACAALVFALSASHSKAAGPFDGIWAVAFQGSQIGYLTLQENSGVLVAVLLETDLTWNAFSGPRSGSHFAVSSLAGAGSISGQYSGTFTSGTTFQATQLSCVPAFACLLPNGAVVTGNKIW